MNEKKVYEGQGMDTSDKNVFPPYRDNGPCCDLVAKSSGKFVGIFPGLDSLSVNDDATDKGFLESLIKTFGRGTAPPKNCNINALRRAAATHGEGQGGGSDNIHHYPKTIHHQPQPGGET